jgi:hypothetical protein
MKSPPLKDSLRYCDRLSSANQSSRAIALQIKDFSDEGDRSSSANQSKRAIASEVQPEMMRLHKDGAEGGDYKSPEKVGLNVAGFNQQHFVKSSLI